MLLTSANDATIDLADLVAGSDRKFAALMDDEAMPPGRNRLPRGPPVWTKAIGEVAVPCVCTPKAFVAPWTAAVLGTWLPGSWAIGGIPPDDWIHSAPIQRGGMSGTVRRSSTATPKAGAVRMTWTGPPAWPAKR